MRKEKDMTTEKRKHLAAWVSIIFIFVTLASLFYIVKEENHKCTGEDCPVCACVHQVEQNLKNLGTGFAVDFCAIFSVLAIVSVICCQTENFFCTSLVSQKVRLNN